MAKTNSSAMDCFFKLGLLDSITGACSPAEAIGGPRQIHHQQFEFTGDTGRTSDDDDIIVDLQRVLIDATVAEL
jgi:hypothetical protein